MTIKRDDIDRRIVNFSEVAPAVVFSLSIPAKSCATSS